MTLIFNSDKYKKLLADYRSKIIKTEEENEKALEIVEELMHRKNRSSEEDELYELLVFLIEKFEQEFYVEFLPKTHSMISFLMEQRDKNNQALAEVLGSQQLALDLLEGKEKVTLEQAKILGNFFHIDANLFLENA